MTIAQTTLVFAGIPIAVMAAMYAVVYTATSARRAKRYRPGMPFTFEPVWFLGPKPRLTAEFSHRAELTVGGRANLDDNTPTELKGGARGNW